VPSLKRNWQSRNEGSLFIPDNVDVEISRRRL